MEEEILIDNIKLICNTYQRWTDAESAIIEIKTKIAEYKDMKRATKKFFFKSRFGWKRQRDGYVFDEEEKDLAIKTYLETGKEP